MPKLSEVLVEEGFVFSKQGIPKFVEFTTGLSTTEDWGRWSDANLSSIVKISLQQPLRGNICLVIKAHTTPKQIGESISIRIGKTVKTWIPETEAKKIYQWDFLLLEPASVIEISPSAPNSPSTWDETNTDARRLGIGFHHLSILKGNCQ